MLRKIRYRIKWLLNDVLKVLGQGDRFSHYKGEVRVLVFHGVCADGETAINARFLTRSRLEGLLKQLSERANFLSLEAYVQNDLHPQKLNLLITFDDGYANNLSVALPLCEQYGVPVTVFVTNRHERPLWTDLLDIQQHKTPESHQFVGKKIPGFARMSNQELKQRIRNMAPRAVEEITDALYMDIGEPCLAEMTTHWQLVSDEALRILSEHPLVTLANHSANHYDFYTLNEQQQEDELEAVKERLQNLDGTYPNVFAYPFGNCDENMIQRLEQRGITHQFCADGTLNPPPGCIDRLTVNPYISIHNQLRAIAHGTY